MANLDAHFANDISHLSLSHEDETATKASPALGAPTNGLVVIDIKDKFTQATQALEPGDIVKDAFFSLFEAVAALEIMDPKMDSGCVAVGEEFEELYDTTRSLSMKEVLGIIDQLICHEMAWHLGYPLAQTILSSVYCEELLVPNPTSIEDANFHRSGTATLKPQLPEQPQSPELEILRAYCLGMLKTSFFVNERVKSEHFYEEEDFVTNTYNRTLLKNVPREDIHATITEAQNLLESLRQASTSEEVIDGLLARLIFRESFLQAAWCDLDASPADTSKEPWERAYGQISLIRSTHGLGTPVPESFSAKLQRKLASTMPPRAIVNIDFDEASGHLERLFKDGLEAIDVLQYSDPQSLQTYVSTFQGKKPQPLMFVRSVLQYFLFNDMQILGSKSIRQILDDDFATVSMPASALLDRRNDEVEAVHDPRFAVAQQMEMFRQRAAQPYLDVLRTFCQNRSRVRRTLCHVVRAWDSLQVDADEMDQIIDIRVQEHQAHSSQNISPFARPLDMASQPLSSWTYVHKLRLMELIVQLGFELEVYQASELAGMYWYLAYLAKCRVHQLRRMKASVERATDDFLAHSESGSDPVAEQQLSWALSWSRLSLLDAVATWQMADALSMLYVVLLRTGALKSPVLPFSDDELRYELRMKPFSSIGIPELPTFQEFSSGTNQPEVPTAILVAHIESAVQGAKIAFETLTKLDAQESFSVGSHERWLMGSRNALKACISTSIVLTSMKKGLSDVGGGDEDGEGMKLKAEVPPPEKLYHEWWIVPKIVPVKT